EQEPDGKCQHSNRDDGWNEVRGDTIGKALNWGAAALRLTDELHDAGEERFTAHELRAHDQRSRGVDRGTDDLGPGFFVNRSGFPGNHRLIDVAATFQHDTIHRDLFPGPYSKLVTDYDSIERDVLFPVAIAQDARRFRSKAEQRADGGPGAAASAKFQNLSQE